MQVAEPAVTAGTAEGKARARGAAVALRGCGVDTWRPSWYVDPEGPAAEWWLENGTPAGASDGGGFRLQHKIAGHVIGMAASGLVYAEGHPSTLLTAPRATAYDPAPPRRLAEDPPAYAELRERLSGAGAPWRGQEPDDDDDARSWLVGAGQLPEAYDVLVRELRDAGVPIPDGDAAELVDLERPLRVGNRSLRPGSTRPRRRREGAAGFARLDVTADFDTPSTVYGRTLLRALTAVALQKGSVTAAGSLGAHETLALRARGGKRLLARFYDKGTESNTAAPFRLLRAEDQGRFPGTRRRGIESIDAAFLRERFRRRWSPLARAGEEVGTVTVADPLVLAEQIQQLADRGVITPMQAVRMAGNVVLDHVSGRMPAGASRTTVWRHRSELIRHGLIRETGELAGEPVHVNLAEPFALVQEVSAWT